MAIKTLTLTASHKAVAIPLHVQTSLAAPREERTGPPHIQGVQDWERLPLRSKFDPIPTSPSLGHSPHSLQDFLHAPKTSHMISGEVVFTAITDPPHQPVTWGGDLGYQRAITANSIRIQYSTPGPKTVTTACQGKTASATVSVFRLEIVEPALNTEFFITAVPAMPPITARATIVGIEPNPTGTTTIDWTAQIRFHAKNNPHGPNRKINPPDVTQKVPGGRFMPAFPQIRGGELTIIAKATYAGQDCEARTVGLKIMGTNPARSAIQAEIAADPSLVPDVQQAIQRVACHESKQRQFLADANGGTGWPLWSGDDKGGVGILQITNPQPSDDEVWNWKANVAAGIKLFKQKIPAARGFPAEVRKSQGFKDEVARYNAWRKHQGLPPLTIQVLDFDDHQLALDTLRAFNGFGGKRQFGLWCHEVRLAMHFAPWRTTLDTSKRYTLARSNWPDDARIQDSDTLDTSKLPDDARIQDSDGQSFQKVLYVININETTKTGDAVWEREPVLDRPSSGDPDYVNHVLNKDPACPG